MINKHWKSKSTSGYGPGVQIYGGPNLRGSKSTGTPVYVIVLQVAPIFALFNMTFRRASVSLGRAFSHLVNHGAWTIICRLIRRLECVQWKRQCAWHFRINIPFQKVFYFGYRASFLCWEAGLDLTNLTCIGKNLKVSCFNIDCQ